MPGSRAVEHDRREGVTGRPAVGRRLDVLEPLVHARQHGLQLGERPQFDAQLEYRLGRLPPVAGAFGDFCGSTSVRTDSTPAALSLKAGSADAAGPSEVDAGRPRRLLHVRPGR